MRTPRILLAAFIALSSGCAQPVPEPKDDEAMVRARREGKAPDVAATEWFPPTDQDYFNGMDHVVVSPAAVQPTTVNTLDTPVYQLLDHKRPPSILVDPKLSSSAIKGRNAWMMWCGGNEGFWDWLGVQFGFVDLLKLIDTDHRANRFRDAGLITEPGMVAAASPSDYEFGLRVDQPADPEVASWRRAYVKNFFARAANRQTDPEPPLPYAKVPRPDVYGLSSGVVGLRLFPNPNFNAEAQRKWNAVAYYDSTAGDPTLVRPYRVGMSCAFCHASFHPLRPPRDVTSPSWENLSATIGSQYMRIRAVFGNLLPKDNFVYHVLDSQPPGTIDTSLIASDNINNPNTMNAVFKLPQRALVSFRNPREQQGVESAQLPSLWRHPEDPPQASDDAVPDLWRQVFASEGLSAAVGASNGNPRHVPRILVDGADSIGGWGALARVYLNIGTNWEQWNQLHLPVVGFQPQRPFLIDDVKKHSVYWHATQLRVAPMRDYFLQVTPSMPLVDARTNAESADERITGSTAAVAAADERLKRIDTGKLPRARQVFARNCIVCHSSVQPPARHAAMNEVAEQRGEYWDHDPGQWLSNPEYIKWALEQVETEDFWRKNYLSTDYRIPVNLVETNACRALATNAVTGNMWQDFSSDSYRRMPSVGSIRYFNPFIAPSGGEAWFTPAHRTAPGVPAGGGGPGFYRVPTLVSIWATAPFLHNNSLGLFNNDASVAGRLAAFDDAIRKLLWPERRLWQSSYNEATSSRLAADHGLIWRTTEDTYLQLAGAYVPGILGAQSSIISRLEMWLPWVKELPREYWPAPSAALLVVALVVLVVAARLWVRLLGYAVIVLALAAGVVVYLLNGGLGDLRIGPIPKGTPVNLLANVNPEAPPEQLKAAIQSLRTTLTEIESAKLDRNDAWKLLNERVAPQLVAVSKCPDFVMDRGHAFEWFKQMTDDDKEALIELLKTF